jgi:hypothetical protein
VARHCEHQSLAYAHPFGITTVCFPSRLSRTVIRVTKTSASKINEFDARRSLPTRRARNVAARRLVERQREERYFYVTLAMRDEGGKS